MNLTEEQLKQIISEEVLEYLEEIRALNPELYDKVLSKLKAPYEKGHIPFTKPHRAKWAGRSENARLDVLIMVFGEPGGIRPGAGKITSWDQLKDSPSDLESVEQYLTQIHGFNKGEIYDKDGSPLVPWTQVQQLARADLKASLEQQRQLAEIIKEEVIKYLKENE